jgi:hypothetical protein
MDKPRYVPTGQFAPSEYARRNWCRACGSAWGRLPFESTPFSFYPDGAAVQP